MIDSLLGDADRADITSRVDGFENAGNILVMAEGQPINGSGAYDQKECLGA
jgi:hypothetical protein